MTQTEIELDEHLKGLLDRLRSVPPLDPQAVVQERANFLAQGELFLAAVSQQPRRRHIGWINTLVLTFQRKERIPMLNTLMAIVVTITLLFSGAGATVYAAQDSLPDEPLYPVKTWSEDVRLSLVSSPQGQLDLTLDYTDRRVAEIASLQATAKPVSEGVTARLQEELDAALQIAAWMDDPQMVQALAQIRLLAETQSQTLTTLMGGGSSQGDPMLARLRERLQEQVRLAVAGEADPQGFRLQVRERLRDRQKMPSHTPNPTQPGPATRTPSVTPVPTGNSYGPGPDGSQTTGTPGHYGPGNPNPSQTPMPTGSSYGPGPGAGQLSATPGGYGPGPQAGTSTCTPAQNGGGPGPGPQNPTVTQQPGGPGPGSGQSTVTPQQGGNPGSEQPTEPPGQGDRP